MPSPQPPPPAPSPAPAFCQCAWCGGWRDDAGAWHPPPAVPPPGRPVTHGICPACYATQAAGDTLPT